MEVAVPVIHAEEAVVHEMHGARFISFAAPSRGSDELCAWRVELPGGTRGVAHTITREEIFCVLSGTLDVTVDGQVAAVRTGDVVVLRAGSPLAVDNPAEETATAWVTTSVGLEAELADGTRITPPWTR
jgi:quercetin dioxygenase-like cupin family protein